MRAGPLLANAVEKLLKNWSTRFFGGQKPSPKCVAFNSGRSTRSVFDRETTARHQTSFSTESAYSGRARCPLSTLSGHSRQRKAVVEDAPPVVRCVTWLAAGPTGAVRREAVSTRERQASQPLQATARGCGIASGTSRRNGQSIASSSTALR